MTRLKPNFSILSESQREVWKRLGATPGDFVLYGGTALALRLGHRASIDFDFFCHRSFQPSVLLHSIPYLEDQPITQQSESTLSCDIATPKGVVKVSFFGGLSLKQIAVPDLLAAVKSVSLQNLPTVSASHSIGEGVRRESL